MPLSIAYYFLLRNNVPEKMLERYFKRAFKCKQHFNAVTFDIIFYILQYLITFDQSFRSSRQEAFSKKVVRKNSAKFTGKHLCWSLQGRFFSVNSAKFLRAPFSQKSLGDCFCIWKEIVWTLRLIRLRFYSFWYYS